MGIQSRILTLKMNKTVQDSEICVAYDLFILNAAKWHFMGASKLANDAHARSQNAFVNSGSTDI